MKHITMSLVIMALGLSFTACKKGEEGADTKGEGTTAAAEKPLSLDPLSQEDCEKACRKWNNECRPEGAPEANDDAISGCTAACVMTTDGSMDKKDGIVSWAQHACLDKADCVAYKECVSEKESELKEKLAK